MLRLDARFHNCPPRVVHGGDYFLADTVVTEDLLLEIGEVEDKTPNFPGILSFRDFEAVAAKLSQITGRQFISPTEARWEYAARPKRDVNQLMEARRFTTMSQLREWLVDGGGDNIVGNFVALGKGEVLTLGSEILSHPRAQRFLDRMQAAGGGICFPEYGTQSGGLNHAEAYYGESCRGPVKYGPPNANGLYDMTGGMLEWCADIYGENAYRNLPQINPFNAPRDLNDNRDRVLRGGFRYFSDPGYLHSAYRYSGPPVRRVGLISGRLAA